MEKPGQSGNNIGKFENGVFSSELHGRNDRQSNGGQPADGKQAYNVNPRQAQQQYPNYYNNMNYQRNYQCPRQCAGCPNSRKPDNMALIVIAAASVAALLIAFLATVFCLLAVVIWISSRGETTYDTYEPRYEDMPFQEEMPNNSEDAEGYGEMPEWTIPKVPGTDSNDSGEYYGEIRDAVRTDLNYTIEWENYEYAGNNDTIMIAVDYPVIKGDVPNADVLNGIIAEETEYFEEYFAEYSKYMVSGEIFGVYAEGFVTYMDEEMMSIVFCENIYTDYWADSGLYCINIDMEGGVVVDNNSIVDVNNEFAVDFRMRSREQNGSIDALDYMTDQEIVYYLSDAGTSIIFYTPLGMEVGLNYGEEYVTVTYKDFEQYLQRF